MSNPAPLAYRALRGLASLVLGVFHRRQEGGAFRFLGSRDLDRHLAARRRAPVAAGRDLGDEVPAAVLAGEGAP